MVSAAHFAPQYSVVSSSTLVKGTGPIKTFAGPPPAEYQQQGAGFIGQFNGVDQLVCTSKCSDHILGFADDSHRQLWRRDSLYRVLGGDASPYGLLEGHDNRTGFHLCPLRCLRRFCKSPYQIGDIINIV